MKKHFLLFIVLFACQCTAAIAKNIDRVEPLFWWVGMKNPRVQIMVYGKNIANNTVKIDAESIILLKVNKVENPNYVFLDIEIKPTAKAGNFAIRFVAPNKKQFTYEYELKDKELANNRIQGVTNKDLIYQLMPDRFSNGDKKNNIVKGFRENTINRDSIFFRHGGDIQGLINHLDYIKELGATAIWLTPEIENDMPLASYHGYASTNHYQIDARYGSNQLYQSFVNKAHEMGLKVIKDVVHNHIGSYHWMMLDLPSKDWIHQWPVYTQTTYKDQTVMDPYASAADKSQMVNGWFVPTMPDLNQDNELVQNYLTQNIIWWVQFAGIDGLRLDTYAYNNLGYMAKWAKQTKVEFPYLSIFGETLVNTTISQTYFTEGNTIKQGLDTGLPGITDVQVKDAIYDVLTGKFDWTTGVNRLYTVLSTDFIYQDPTRNVIFLDNHDMSRFYSMIGEDLKKFKSGLAILLTMRGIPQLYYGTEILMKNFSNPDGLVRSDFPGGWENDKENKFYAAGRTEKENEAFNYVKKLANYRKQTPALQTGKLMQYVPRDGLYVYFRYDESKTIMVVVNSNNKPMSLSTERFIERLKDCKIAVDIMNNQSYNLSQNISIPDQSTLVFEIR